jgi:hypothetical protein
MKKLTLLTLIIGTFLSGYAQSDTGSAIPKKDWSKINMGNRSGDHLMVQLGYDGWLQDPDTVRTKGLSRSLNVYFMLDFPFKTDPRWSVALGAGISSSNIFLDKTIAEVAGSGTRLNFRNVADTNHFKKYKLVTAYAEVPLELRYSTNPENSSGGFKVAVGVKIGTMLSAHTKGKNLQNKGGSTLNAFTVKESSKRFFNSTRLSSTLRIGYGNFSVFGNYQITNLLKDGAGPVIHPYSIGLTLSGL